MQEINKQVTSKTVDPLLSHSDLMNSSTTKPSCFSKWPGRSMECGAECSLVNECHSEFQRKLFYGEED